MRKLLLCALLAVGLLGCEKEVSEPSTNGCPTFILPNAVRSLETGKPEWIGRKPVYGPDGSYMYLGYVYRQKC